MPNSLIAVFAALCLTSSAGMAIAWRLLRRARDSERAGATREARLELAFKLERAEKVIHGVREALSSGSRRFQ